MKTRKTNKRKTNKRKINKRKINKRKTNKRKTKRRKTNKRKYDQTDDLYMGALVAAAVNIGDSTDDISDTN